ncbi:phage tail protein [Streptococcus pseudopneumoniae]|uniref:phage tail spike protein n=2 Tax=Streptococcus pseudopneumoniae TaxID=257758 RepID=UPI0018B09FB6|nr:phage tail spike protein [Streptococcus pseudopneumoniae]MBF9675020.1 phage tail protein [Streptococcus pseudopneumoniae]
MIYLTEGNRPLNEAYNDEIVHLGNNTYQLTFRFPTSDPKWELLKEETFLTADDLHGEQDFYIFEVEKQQGYIQVYANQVISLLNNYIVSSIEVDRVSGTRVLSAFAGSITRANPFSFFSDIDDRHTLNIKDKNAMEVLAKDKHSILGQWGGDMVRNGYNLRLLKNGGSENESLFMYKKNLSSYQHKTSMKSLKTRITFKTTVKGEGENAVDHDYMVVIDSPLLGNYSQIYEDVVEVNDQDVTDEASLIAYGKQYFRTSMCDMLEDNLEISVVGQSDVAVQMFDVVSIYHEWYGLDVRKKITKYTYSPMAKRLKSIGFGTFQSSLANAIGGIVNDAVLNESRNLHQIFEERLKKEIANADRAFDAEFTKREKAITDAIELAKAKAEEVKQEVSDTINQRFNSFHDEPLRESRRKAEEALRQAGASSSLAQEAKQIGLDSVARLEAFKSQTRSAQTALSGDLNLLKQTVTNDISSKQRQLKTDISKQVQALGQIKNDLAGVRSSQARYEETTKGRLTALTNRMEGKANKSEVRQTAETLTSQIDRIQEESSTRISTMTSRFNQRADALDAGVRRLTEGLRTKADISSLNVTAENIRQSVRRLERDTQSQLNQKLSTAEFEVRAGSIRQEILNATKDKADKTLVVAEAGKLREEFSNMQVGGRNYYRDSEKIQQSPFSFGFVFDNLGPYLSKSDIGTTWTLSFDFKLDEVDGSFPFHMSHGGANGFGIEGRKEFTATREWQRFRFTGPVFFKEDAPSESKLQMTLFNSDLGYGGPIFIRRIKLEKGTLATDWSPALEDTNGLITQAKASFERTAQELRTDLSAVQAYVTQDGQRQESLQRYTREESARQARAVREQISRDYVGKSSYQEDVEGIHRRIEGVKTSANREITSQIASYRQSADGTFRDISSRITTYKQDMTRNIANLSHQLAGKVETTDFQRVRESSQLYERILGNTENGIADKVARMAMTNQLFQVEVGKYSVSGPNLIKNSDFKNDTNKWVSTQNLGRLVKHSFYHNGQKDLMRLSNATKNKNFLSSHRFNLERNTDYVLNFRGFNNSALASYDVYILGRRAGESDGFTIFKKVVSSKKLSTSRCEDVSVTFNSGEMDNAYIRFENNGSSSGTADLYITEVDLYKGYKPRTWQPHPEDAVADANKKLEATQTKMTQLAGSWLVQNINSAGDLISGINLGANGHNRLSGKLTHITGETLIDRAVIKSAMVDKLKTANFESGSVTTAVLAAEAVTADKVKFDHAFIRKLIANDAFIGELTSKRIFATKIESVVNRSTFLEAYQGQIGGFTIGRFAQGRGRWISGVNQFSVGMGNGEGGSYNGENTAFWANWGYSWNSPGPNAWYVTTLGNMHCRNGADFHGKTDFSQTSNANFYGGVHFEKSPFFKNGIEMGNKDIYGEGGNPAGGRNRTVWWNQLTTGLFREKAGITSSSDRRLKENIKESPVNALDKIQALNMVSFDFIESQKHEEVGLIAQEVQEVVPHAVETDEVTSYLSINYSKFVPYLLKAVQELDQKIKEMENTHG